MATGINPDFLMQIEFFSRFETEAVKLILLTCEQQGFAAGEIVFKRGDISDGGYVIASGRIALYEGDTAAAPALLAGPGVLIGELALISVTERPASAIAVEASSLLQISRGSFKRILQEYPLSAERLRERVSSRLSTFMADLKLIA